jgi:hypothetical protein
VKKPQSTLEGTQWALFPAYGTRQYHQKGQLKTVVVLDHREQNQASLEVNFQVTCIQLGLGPVIGEH